MFDFIIVVIFAVVVVGTIIGRWIYRLFFE